LVVSVFSHLSGFVALSATLKPGHQVSFRHTVNGTYLVLSHPHKKPAAVSHHHHHHHEHTASQGTHHHHDQAVETATHHHPDHVIHLPEQSDQAPGHLTKAFSELGNYFQPVCTPCIEVLPQLFLRRISTMGLLAEPPPWETSTEAILRTTRLLI
jgi:hypothetical protein